MSDAARLQDLFDRAADLPEEERGAWLRAECLDDPPLADEVAKLLAADTDAEQSPFWRRSALEHEAFHIASAPDPAIGTHAGAYVLTEFIGSGGMGRVYRGVRADAAFEREVAIKRLNVGGNGAALIARFHGERRILASLDHPHIARLIDGGSDADGLPYLVMEYVEGVTPAEYCAAHDVPLDGRLQLFRRIASAVQYAHERMVIHRDLKPGNVLVTADGTPKLLDFGIARLMTPDDTGASAYTAAPLMTLRYASPEQIRGEPLTTSSDVYALGVLLYELLTGRSPYAHPDGAPPVVMRAVCEEAPPKPSAAGAGPRCRGDIDTILLKALRKDPADRYTLVEQFSDDVGRFLDGRPVVARGESWSYRASKFVRRRKALATVAALLLVTLVTGIVMIERSRAQAERRFNDVRALAHQVIFEYQDAMQDLPGSTAIRQRMVKDALEYLDQLSQEADTPSLRRELVDAYVRISQLQGNSYNTNLGDSAGAITSAAKAVANAERLLAKDGSPESLRSAAHAYTAEASLTYSAGDLAGADIEYRKTLDLQERARRLEPGNEETTLEAVATLRFLGDLYGGTGMQNLGKTEEAVAWYQRSAVLIDEFLAAHPGDDRGRRQRYQTMLEMASAEGALGHGEQAMQRYRAALVEIEALAAADLNNVFNQFELAGTNLRIGIRLMDERRAQEALPYLERSAAAMRRLSTGDPESALYKRSLSVNEGHWARALRAAGDPASALAHNTLSIEIAERLSAADPGSAEHRADVAVTHRKRAETYLALGENAAAEADASMAATALLALVAASPDAWLEGQAGRALLARGDARRARKDPARALADASQALAIASRLSGADRVNAILQSDVAHAQVSRAAALGDLGRSREAIEACREAIGQWDDLNSRHALTGEDAALLDLTRRLLAKLQARG